MDHFVRQPQSLHIVPTVGQAGSLSEAADKLAKEDDIFFSSCFLLQRPLLKTILRVHK
jgi:hypothetical protein